jgi:hypothetical protein
MKNQICSALGFAAGALIAISSASGQTIELDELNHYFSQIPVGELQQENINALPGTYACIVTGPTFYGARAALTVIRDSMLPKKFQIQLEILNRSVVHRLTYVEVAPGRRYGGLLFEDKKSVTPLIVLPALEEDAEPARTVANYNRSVDMRRNGNGEIWFKIIEWRADDNLAMRTSSFFGRCLRK